MFRQKLFVSVPKTPVGETFRYQKSHEIEKIFE